MKTCWKHSALCLLTGACALQASPSNCKLSNSFEQGHEIKQSRMAAAYNAPGRIDVRGSWDLFLTGSYLYWQPLEEGLDLGISNASSSLALPLNGHVVSTDFQFKSGYQVGLGIYTEFDNWDGLIEYTWLPGSHTAHSNGPVGGGLIPSWGHPANISANVFSGKGVWDLLLRAIDINVGRSYYVGTRLIFRPFFGVRPVWIDQDYKATYSYITPISLREETYTVHSTSNCWGVGPQLGLQTSWVLGCGFRLIGNAETDILFTRYNLRYKEQATFSGLLLGPVIPETDLSIDVSQHDLYCLRQHTDLALGFGWGTYFSNYNYHLDISALYEFQAFQDQNMFLNFVDNSSVGKVTVPNGNLYIQGVTGALCFDF